MKRSSQAITRSLRTIWLISPVVLLTLLAVVLVRQAVPAGAAAHSSSHAAAGPPPTTVLASFRATGLPSGPATITALVVHLPAGLHFKHVHGGNVYNYIIKGSLTSVDGGVARTYRAGQFFWEPVGHAHTLITTRPATFFSLAILTPRAELAMPVQ